MADDEIKPTQPLIPTPAVSPPPEERRRHREKAPTKQQSDEQSQDSKKIKEEHRGESIDEYV